MNISIREATTDDFPEIIELFQEFAAFEKRAMVNSLKKMIKEKDFFHCFVAESSEKKIIGYASYFYCYYTWTGKSMHLDDLYVKPEFRAKGIGKHLINKVIDLAKSSECHKLHWQVSGWNEPAKGFYRKLGATIDSTEENCDLLLD